MTTARENDPVANMLREHAEMERAARVMLAALKMIINGPDYSAYELWSVAHDAVAAAKAAGIAEGE